MEGVPVITIGGLLKRRRPVSGAHSLLLPSPSPSAAPPSGNAKTLNPDSFSSYKVLRSLVEPCVIFGTLNLPTNSYADSMPPRSPCNRNCFSFSDDSASVCCDVLEFDVHMVGKKILVVSWNFIPLQHSGGFLEIIKWQFPADSFDYTDDWRSLSLMLGSAKHGNDIHKACRSVCGLLESVSPIFAVPCTIGGGQKDSVGSAINPKSLCGFVVQILACSCKSCCSKDVSSSSHVLTGNQDTHAFRKESFVYFIGTALSWHLAIVKLVGNVISLSRLKKKLIYMGEEEKELIYVTTEETCLHLPSFHYSVLSLESSTMMNRNSFGVYNGVVRGIYVQGMVVEVDEDVWLLLTDQLLMPPHSIRVGAVITVRNVHIVNPKFPWRKMLILGACSKTSISLTSFSPLETGCHQLLQSTSLLGKYIGSLIFPARLWVLLIAQSLRKKFAGSFSEKEILGSNHKEGIAQKYARSILSKFAIRPPQVGVFMEFCKHASCGCSSKLSCPTLNLVVPLITFVNNCAMMWTRSLFNIIDANNLPGHFSNKHGSHGSKIKKIFPSEGSGVSLLGNIKISPTTGMLQLIDDTCSINVVVPDLPSSWNVKDIFEVFDYSIVVEGDPGRICNSQKMSNDAFSCRNIFQGKSSVIDENLDIYVFFSWRNAICRITPVITPVRNIFQGNYIEPESGNFHLFLLTHKFPIRPKISGDSLISNKAGFFAEAILLPWDLYLATNDNDTLSTDIPVENLKRCCLEDGFPNKRCKVDCASSFFQKLGSSANCTYGAPELRSCSKSHDLFNSLKKVRMSQILTDTTPVEIPCFVTGRSVQGQSTIGPGILCYTETNIKDRSTWLASGRKLLLEFNCETIQKYKLLKIGCWYAIKHSAKESFCDLRDIKYDRKVIINPDMHFWSLSFFFEGDVSNVDPSHNHSSDSCFTIDESSENSIQRKLVFHCSKNTYYDCHVDANLQISSEAIQLFALNIHSLKEAVTNLVSLSNEIPSVSEPIGTGSTNFVLDQHPARSLHNGSHMLEGNLVTVCGTVVSLRCTSKNQCHMGAGAVHHLKSYQEGRQVVCLHISTDNDIVKIDGVLCKVDYPIGLGLGTNATFHRLLPVSGKNHLMLMPVSFITINYVSESKRSLKDQFVNPLPYLNLSGSTNTFLKSVYDKLQNESTLRRFCCKVVAVHTVILGGSCEVRQVHPENYPKLTSVSIPIAGFIIDDGSLPYCCWANSENAVKLLRLHEGSPIMPHQRSSYLLEGLKKILDNHHTITVTNYGSFFDSLCQDLQVYGASDYKISPSDEELLKSFALNTCSGPLWNVTGHMMDSGMVKEVEKCLKDQPMLHSMPNILATEVAVANMLAEARDIFQSLREGSNSSTTGT